MWSKPTYSNHYKVLKTKNIWFSPFKKMWDYTFGQMYAIKND